MTLRELRKQKKLTQAECAEYVGIPLRTYQNYETDEKKRSSLKYDFMMLKLEQYGVVDEAHGILSIQSIKRICNEVFADYDVLNCKVNVQDVGKEHDVSSQVWCMAISVQKA